MENQSRISDLLLHALENLLKINFQKFKDKLSNLDEKDEILKGKTKIPRGRLENAKWTDTKNLLMEYYGGAHAVDITIDVLTQINCRESAHKLRVERDKALGLQRIPEMSASAYKVKYREHIQREYCIIQDMNARLGEHVMLNSRYTKLIIVKEHRDQEEREHEIKAWGRRHAELMAKQASSITIEKLFEAVEKIVVMQGAAGIGKTLTAQKIMLDWANGELYQGMFDYVFYIHCREINVGEQGSVEDLILKNCPDQNAPTKDILMNTKKLLFIIDGFDELRFSFNHSESHFSSDPSEKQPIEITLSSLLRRKVLPESHLLITTRPTALETLRESLGKKAVRYAEILGFSEKERKEYFDKFFENEEQARKAFNCVKENEMLFTMCFVPIVCWITCSVLKQQMRKGEDLGQTSTTITDVYMSYLFSLLEHDRNSKQEAQNNLKELCSLAADGIWREKILFEEDDVKKYGLDKPDSLFLNENMFQKVPRCACLYSFIHLSFQEFFAALFYVLEKEERVKKFKNAIQPVEKLFEKSEKSRNNLMFTVRFLFGLLNKERLDELEKKLSCKISPEIIKILKTLIKEKLFLSLFRCIETYANETTVFCLEYFHCLYEIQETEFVQNSMNHFTELTLTSRTFTKMDEIVILFCVKHCSKLESLGLQSCNFLTDDLTEDQNEDSPGPSEQSDGAFCIHSLASLGSKYTFITEPSPISQSRCLEGSATSAPDRAEPQDELHQSSLYWILKAIQDPNCKVKMVRAEPQEEPCEPPIYWFCQVLKDPNCKLKKLSLERCDLTSSCCEKFASALKSNRSLIELKLNSNNLYKGSIQLLCEGLKGNCKLQILRLHFLGWSVSYSECLAAFLQTNRSLIELDLHDNTPKDRGIQLLCKGLKENCKLKILRLSECKLTDACCEDLASALRTNQSLIKLDLSNNDLRDHGVQLLCEGLKQNCKLQSLNLGNCRLTESCCKALASALETNKSLINLDLGYCLLRDSGVQLLCEGLKQNCILQSLRLKDITLKDPGFENLAAVLRANQSLIELDLSGGCLNDRSLQLLCDGLKGKCKLQRLNLRNSSGYSLCSVTPACCRYLADLLKTGCSLRKLDLGDHNLEDAGVQVLCEGLKHQNCKLEALGLRNCALTDACCRYLSSVFITSQTLIYLDIDEIKLEDSGVQQLCEGLKHPNCKLQTLRLRKSQFGYILKSPDYRGLAALLKTNRSLRKLDVGDHRLGDSRVQVLCEGLKNPNCKVEALGLNYCNLTDACCGDLSAALITSQTLTYLDIWGIKLENSGMQQLCEGLKHPNCKLQTLRIWYRDLTPEMQAQLDAVKMIKPDFNVDESYHGVGITEPAWVWPHCS